MTESEKILNQIARRLSAKTIHELRQVAREVGVKCPAAGKKDRLVEDCLNIAAGRINPVPKIAVGNKVGAPPKSRECDRQLVSDILACRERLKTTLEKEESFFVTVSNNKADLLDFRAEGILEKSSDMWFMRTGLPHTQKDVFVNEKLIARFNLREGDIVGGRCIRENLDEIAGLATVTSVNGANPEEASSRKNFEDLVTVYPEKHLTAANGADDVAGRMVDLFAPVGAGQRAFITGARGSGKTAFLKNLASGIAKNNDVKLIILLIDAKPEDAADFERSFPNVKIFSSGMERGANSHVRAARLALEYAKRQAELCFDAVIVMDGLTELARAYNCRGGLVNIGLDTAALDGTKKFVAAARNTKDGGSVTLIASLRTGGGDAVDEAVYSGLKDACNMCVRLTGKYSDPPFDISSSYASDGRRLLSDGEFKTAIKLRESGRVDLFLKTKSNSEIGALINGEK